MGESPPSPPEGSPSGLLARAWGATLASLSLGQNQGPLFGGNLQALVWVPSSSDLYSGDWGRLPPRPQAQSTHTSMGYPRSRALRLVQWSGPPLTLPLTGASEPGLGKGVPEPGVLGAGGWTWWGPWKWGHGLAPPVPGF